VSYGVSFGEDEVLWGCGGGREVLRWWRVGGVAGLGWWCRIRGVAGCDGSGTAPVT